MDAGIDEVVERALASGEAFLPLLSRKGARVGVSATSSGGSVLLEVEVQIRLLPPSERMEMEALSRTVEALECLIEAGFALSHYSDCWVIGRAPALSGDIDAVAERALQVVRALD